jgi:hypothetical protein
MARVPAMSVEQAREVLARHNFTPGKSKTKRLNEDSTPEEIARVTEIKAACRVLHEAELAACRERRPAPLKAHASEPVVPRPRMPEDVPTREQRAAAQGPGVSGRVSGVDLDLAPKAPKKPRARKAKE